MLNLNNLTAETLDAIERDLSAKADQLWDRGCWAPEEMNEIVELIKSIRKELTRVRTARTDLTAEALIR